jgi:hypothetical protein
MELDWAINRLTAQEAAISWLVAGIDGEDARRRPAPGAWSIVEVMAHLLDEEREDFRQRLDFTLHHQGRPWPPIDPEGWVTARAYQDRNLSEVVPAWRAERQRSLAWLRGIGSPDLNLVGHHPAGFQLRAGDLLASWVAHDVLHMRQLVELRYSIVVLRAGAFTTDYAGDW